MNQTHPLGKQSVLLTAALSLQPSSPALAPPLPVITVYKQQRQNLNPDSLEPEIVTQVFRQQSTDNRSRQPRRGQPVTVARLLNETLKISPRLT